MHSFYNKFAHDWQYRYRAIIIGLFFEPVLCNAIFQTEGKMPVLKDKLTKAVIIGINKVEKVFKILDPIASQPVALPLDMSLICFSIKD
jgi:hypothetical protein